MKWWKDLRETYSASWDIRLSSFLCLHPLPLPHQELPGPHTGKYFPCCWSILLLDMYLWLVLIDHLTQWAWDWLFPSVFANTICFMHNILWPPEKRSGTRFLFPLGSTATEELLCVTAAMFSCSYEVVCSVVKMTGVVGRKSNVQSNCLWTEMFSQHFLNSYKSHCAGLIF